MIEQCGYNAVKESREQRSRKHSCGYKGVVCSGSVPIILCNARAVCATKTGLVIVL